RVLTLSNEDLLRLSALEFDVAFCVDKSLVAAGVIARTKVKKVFGFLASAGGAILPATPEAEELWHIGLSNEKKFHINKKAENQLVAEALGLPFERDPYVIRFSAKE